MLSLSPDQMASAGSYIARNWGDFGYSIEEIESPGLGRVSLFHVVANDGSRFTVLADRWGNVRHADTHSFGGYDRSGRLAFLLPVIEDMTRALDAL
jgi:hypothetical protein